MCYRVYSMKRILVLTWSTSTSCRAQSPGLEATMSATKCWMIHKDLHDIEHIHFEASTRWNFLQNNQTQFGSPLANLAAISDLIPRPPFLQFRRETGGSPLAQCGMKRRHICARISTSLKSSSFLLLMMPENGRKPSSRQHKWFKLLVPHMFHDLLYQH